MIITENIGNVQYNKYDQVWAIVRSLKVPEKSLIHVLELSPSPRLFEDYRRWLHEGEWNTQTFENLYKPCFLTQMATDPSAQSKLDELAALDAAGKSIALVCYCTDVNLCHRSLVAKILCNRGIPVTMR